jgi:hypothetical protein
MGEPLANIGGPVILGERSDKNLMAIGKYEILRFAQDDKLIFCRKLREW